MKTGSYAWKYDPSSSIGRSLSENLRSFPRENDIYQNVINLLFNVFLKFWFRIYNRISVKGAENLPKHGSFILAANHASHLDAPVLMSLLPLCRSRKTYPAAAADFFFHDTASSFLSCAFINAMPFDRKRGFRHSIENCRSLLLHGDNVLIIFPEGTRSTNGVTGEFKSGIGLITAGTVIPVIPCAIEGTAKSMPKGSVLLKPSKIKVTIGTPRHYMDFDAGKSSVEAISSDLKAAVESLKTA